MCSNILPHASFTNTHSPSFTVQDKFHIQTEVKFKILGVFQVIVLLVILVMRKRIKLVIQLFKEAGKAINSMPLLLFEPLLVSDYSLIPEIYCTVLSQESLLGQRGRKTMEKYQLVKSNQVNYSATADVTVLKNSTFIFPILGPVTSGVPVRDC
jgi:hypothetical protein